MSDEKMPQPAPAPPPTPIAPTVALPAASTLPKWLPARLRKDDFPDEAILEVTAYGIFQTDWVTRAVFHGDEVRVHRHPHRANANRWQTYWHCVTEGEPEEVRKRPMVDRLERIPWSRPVIDNESDQAAGIKVWANSRGRDQHVCVWFEPENYLVVLKIAYDHFVLITTYCPESRRRVQLQRDYSTWKKTGRAF